MGRYYRGDINGKFWFGIQSSDDAACTGVNPEYRCEYYGCGCYVDLGEDLTDDSYCESCYTSVSEHRENTQAGQTWFLRELCFYFSRDDLPSVSMEKQRLEVSVGHFMTGYTITGDTESGFEYEYTIPEEYNKVVTPDEREEIARLCLVNLIAHCIDEKGECRFEADT